MFSYGPILKPNEVGAHLFRVKGELENILRSIKEWRATGVDDSKVVPLSVVALEKQLESTLTEINSMIAVVSQIKLRKKKSREQL
jgi:hypothetical protein